MRQNAKIQLDLEDPKQANHPLGFYSPTKGRLGVSKKDLKGPQSCSTLTFLVAFSFLQMQSKNFELCNFEVPEATKTFSTIWDTPSLPLVGGLKPSGWLLV